MTLLVWLQRPGSDLSSTLSETQIGGVIEFAEKDIPEDLPGLVVIEVADHAECNAFPRTEHRDLFSRRFCEVVMNLVPMAPATRRTSA